MQSDPLSPKLFYTVLENVFRKLDWPQIELNVDEKKLRYLRFANEVIPFEANPYNLEAMIQALSKESAAIEIYMNTEKTKPQTSKN